MNGRVLRCNKNNLIQSLIKAYICNYYNFRVVFVSFKNKRNSNFSLK